MYAAVYLENNYLSFYTFLETAIERKSILEKASMLVKNKKWTKVMRINIMSSEGSDSEDPNNDDIIVKLLEWRSAIVNQFLSKLDDKTSLLRR